MRVFAGKIHGGNIVAALRTAMDWIKWESHVPSGATVFIKPNFTWLSHLPGITTSPQFLSALVEILRDRTNDITIGESDGGYNAYTAEEAFRGHGLNILVSRYGVKVVNLSGLPAEERSGIVGGREVSVRLPSYLLRDVDVFLTAPVPKIHAMTQVSLGFKNQWGCLPDIMRLREHSEFDRKIVLINKLLKPRIVVFDGLYFLDKTGPTVGEPVRMDLVVASDDVGAGSLACCRIMGVDPFSASHHVVARDEGLMPDSLNNVETNADIGALCRRKFRLQRSIMNWVALAAFKSKCLTKLVYDCRVADWMHLFLYSVRRSKLVARLVYGRVGAPPIEGRRTGSIG